MSDIEMSQAAADNESGTQEGGGEVVYDNSQQITYERSLIL